MSEILVDVCNVIFPSEISNKFGERTGHSLCDYFFDDRFGNAEKSFSDTTGNTCYRITVATDGDGVADSVLEAGGL